MCSQGAAVMGARDACCGSGEPRNLEFLGRPPPPPGTRGWRGEDCGTMCPRSVVGEAPASGNVTRGAQPEVCGSHWWDEVSAREEIAVWGGKRARTGVNSGVGAVRQKQDLRPSSPWVWPSVSFDSAQMVSHTHSSAPTALPPRFPGDVRA